MTTVIFSSFWLISVLYIIGSWPSDRKIVFINKLRGHPVIVIESGNDMWESNLYTRPDNTAYAWRFPWSKIGLIKLEKDGTGYYCGPVRWWYK